MQKVLIISRRRWKKSDNFWEKYPSRAMSTICLYIIGNVRIRFFWFYLRGSHRPSTRRAQIMKLRGLQLEVAARRPPRLLLKTHLSRDVFPKNISKCGTALMLLKIFPIWHHSHWARRKKVWLCLKLWVGGGQSCKTFYLKFWLHQIIPFVLNLSQLFGMNPPPVVSSTK